MPYKNECLALESTNRSIFSKISDRKLCATPRTGFTYLLAFHFHSNFRQYAHRMRVSESASVELRIRIALRQPPTKNRVIVDVCCTTVRRRRQKTYKFRANWATTDTSIWRFDVSFNSKSPVASLRRRRLSHCAFTNDSSRDI